jgi:branched-chain amino acid transport system ATP-binding protein
MLEVTQVEVAYDGQQVLWGPSITVKQGEVVCLLGPNGAGKSTLVNAISGLVPIQAGSITLMGHRIDNLPTHRRMEAGLAHVLERRRVFPFMTVLENLKLGAYIPRAREQQAQNLEWVLSLYPRLRERLSQMANTLSGGEQQMLAMGRGLMSKPRLLILDEPYLGLTPRMVHEISETVLRINREDDVTVLFIEQNVQEALEYSQRGYVLEAGQIALEGTSQELLADPRIQEVYLGV